ncbi:MAG: hypothetical protein PUB20_02980 [Clostridia bacterium]|nr:hypothetical protein [Clostridia bacterium]
MIKGVNHQVVEVTKPSCEYFERIIFFVKPEFSAVSEGTLRDRADEIAGNADSPPPTKLRRRKFLAAAKLICAAIAGASVAIIIMRFIS